MLNPKEKCAVFLDIDGTLLADTFIIPQANLDAIAAARAKGHLVFINTGRSLGNIPEVLMNQLNFDGIVAGSGAMIIMDGEVKADYSMAPDLVRRVYEYILAHNEYWAIFEGKKDVYALSNDVHERRSYQIPLGNSDDYIGMCADDVIQVIAMGKIVPEEFIELFKDEITVFQF